MDDRLAGRQGHGGKVTQTAAEQRRRAAHGETVGINVQMKNAPDGAKEISVVDFLPPLSGLDIFG
jgi:hypothetical protein